LSQPQSLERPQQIEITLKLTGVKAQTVKAAHKKIACPGH
jgi:hypothetical protein